MKVKTVEVSNRNWMRKSIMAYLEGEQNLKWTVAIISGGIADAKETLICLKNYGDRQRYQELADWLALQP